MKKLLLIILLGVGLVNASPAQQYFNLRDAMHSIGTIITSVVQKDGKYYVTGLCTDSSNYVGNNTFTNVEGIRFAIYDSTGIKLRDTFYQKAYLKAMEPWNSSNLYAMPDNTFLMASQYLDTTKWNALIIKFDSLGNKLWEKEYAQPFCNSNDWYKIVDFKPTGTGEWLLYGDVLCNINATQTYNALALTKLDSNFNVIWSKEYGNPPDNHMPTKVLIEPDGYLLASGVNNTNLVTSGFYFRPEMIKIDSAGNVQWSWVRTSGFCNAANDVIKTSDGGYIYCGAGDGFEDFEPNFKGWVEKLDANRNSVWYKSFNAYYYTTQFKVVKETAGGDILLFGDKYCPVRTDSDDANLHTRGWYMRLNANGDSITEHTYYKLRTCNDENHIYDVKQTTDGGFIMVGESTDYCGGGIDPVQRGWLVKIDSNGCIDPLTCDQQDTSTAVKQLIGNSEQIRVYPNPVSDVLQISYSNITDGQIVVMDMMGRVLIDKKLEHSVDVKNLPSGVYLYRVTEKGNIKGQGKIVKE